MLQDEAPLAPAFPSMLPSQGISTLLPTPGPIPRSHPAPPESVPFSASSPGPFTGQLLSTVALTRHRGVFGEVWNQSTKVPAQAMCSRFNKITLGVK